MNLRLKAHGNNVEKIFSVQPHVDPAVIILNFEGGKIEKIKDNGELVIKTDLGEVSFTKPVAYQEINGTKTYVESAYTIKDGGYGFAVGNYVKEKELVIDPLLASTFIGGMRGDEYSEAIAIDATGNVYVAGMTDDASNFSSWVSDTRFYSHRLGSSYSCSMVPDYGESYDAFIFKLSSDLSTLLAYTFIGGNSFDAISAIAIDNYGNVYATGVTESDDYPTTPQAYDTSYNGSNVLISNLGKDVFVSKFSSDLSILLGSTYLGGSSFESVSAMVLNANGDVYITGETNSSDFPATAKSYNANFNDIYISKLSSDLSTILASTFIGGTFGDSVSAIALDRDGNVYVAGETGSTDYPTTVNAYSSNLNAEINSDVFISKLDMELSTLLASTYIGGRSFDGASAMSIDKNGNIYITGWTESADYPTTEGVYSNTGNGLVDVFVSKLNSDLSTLLASTYIGGEFSDYPSALAIDNNGNIYITGVSTHGYPVTAGAYNTNNGDAFISKLSSDLSMLLASTFIGASPSALALDKSGNIYFTGKTSSPDYPSTQGAYDTFFNAGYDGCHWHFDAFISKLDMNLSAPVVGGSPKISVNPRSVNFSPVKTGGTSAPRSVIIKNTGKSALVINSIGVDGLNAPEFEAIPEDKCIEIASGDTCRIHITFKPSFSFGKKKAMLRIESNDSGKSVISIKLSGIAPPPKISARPAAVNFGKVGIGEVLTKTVTIKNTGLSDLVISLIDIVDANVAEFSQTNTCTSPVIAGSTCTITVTYTPTDISKKSAAIRIVSNDPQRPTIKIRLSVMFPYHKIPILSSSAT